jgi:hypothetical protein
LHKLLEGSRSAQWYQLTDYHWLLLYEVLKVHCEIFNDGEGYACEVPGKYGIRYIDFNAVVERFFWDIDFLLPGEEVMGLGMEGRKQLAISPETFGLTQGLKPHPEELCLQAIEPGEEPSASDFYRPGSEYYPDHFDLES